MVRIKTRTICFLCAALLMSGCQPAPEKEAVINKNDGSFEEKIQQTSSYQELGDIKIQHADMFTSTDGSLNFHINLDQTIRVEGLPVVEVAPHTYTGEEIKHIGQILLPGVTYYERENDMNPLYSKGELTASINRWSQYTSQEAYAELSGQAGVDYSDDIEALKMKIQQYTDMLETAPEENPHTACEWQFKPENHYFEGRPHNNDIIQATAEIDGVHYSLSAVTRKKEDYILNGVSLSIGATSMDRLIYAAQMCRTEKPDAVQINEAKCKAQELLDQIDQGMWKVQRAELVTKYCGEIPEYSIMVKATPILGGIAALDGQRNWDPINENVFSSDYYVSSAFFSFSPNGTLMNFGLDSPIDIVSVINTNVAILPVSELFEIAQNNLMLSDKYTHYGIPDLVKRYEDMFGENIVGTIQVSDFRLGLARIKVPEKSKNYYYIPAIALYGTADYYGQDTNKFYMGSGEPFGDRVQALIWLNAVDGSYI